MRTIQLGIQHSDLGVETSEATNGRFVVSLIIPAYNEARGLRRVLPAVPAWISEVIIVDGGSIDGTCDVVRDTLPRARVVRQTSRGKGGAIKEGIRASRGDIIVTMDGDGSMDPGDILPAVTELMAGADFVKGSRCLDGAGSADFTIIRQLGNTALTRVANVLFHGEWTDITYGFNAYWRAAIAELDPLSDGFQFEIQAAIQAARAGLITAEVATYEAPRVGGKSKLSPLSDGWAILKVILGEARPRSRATFRRCADIYLANAPGSPQPPVDAEESRLDHRYALAEVIGAGA